MNSTDLRLKIIADKRANDARNSSRPAPNGIFVKVEARMRESLAGLRGAPLSVLLYLGLRIGSNFMCNPSVRLIAVETGYSEATVHRALRFLKRNGYIDFETQDWHGEGRTPSNSYTVKVFFAYGRHSSGRNGDGPESEPDDE